MNKNYHKKLILILVMLFSILHFQTVDEDKDNNTKETQTDKNNCIKGCLQCGENLKCLLCDTQNDYFMKNEGECTLSPIENCNSKSQTGCVQCIADYFLFEGKCTQITSNLKITNCEYYTNTNNVISCQKCIKDHYQLEGACVQVQNKIENCMDYDSKGQKCIKCENMVPSLDFNSCIKYPDFLENCNRYSFLKCNKCSSGYMESKNYVSDVLSKQQISVEDNNAIKNIIQTNNSLDKLLSLNFCQQIQHKNCLVPISIFECETCNKGYFLGEDKICYLYPEEKIENCQNYQSNKICSECMQGYWRKEVNSCVEVLEISQCKIYSNVEEQKCLECDEEYYLSDNECVKREISKSIEFCQKNFLNLDQCETCEEGFETNLDMNKCLQIIPNCGKHNKNLDSLDCVECLPNFYLEEGKCNSGDIEGCEVYQNKTVCLDCKRGYYKNPQGACIIHQLANTLSCFSFSITNQNFCDICPSSKVKFSIKNVCLKTEGKLENCIEYESETKCKICDNKKSYLKNDVCVEGTIANCSLYEKDKNKCLNCVLDSVTQYGMIPNKSAENNSCVIQNPNIYQNCQEINNDSEKSCLYCKQGYYQQILKVPDLKYCVPRDYYLFSGKVNYEQCNHYDYNNQKCLQCLKKSDGNFYVSHNGQCMDTCPQNYAIQTFEIENKKIISQFVCKPFSYFQDPDNFTQNYQFVNGISCKRFELDINDQSKIYCAECASNHIGVYKQNTTKITLKYQYLLSTSINSTMNISNMISPIKSCVARTIGLTTDENGTRALSILNNSTITINFNNCRFVEQYKDTDQYYCTVCKHGYSGKVVKSINSEYVYMIENCEIMTQCKSDVWIDGFGSYYNQTNQTLISSTTPKNFDQFLSCHQCNQTADSDLIPTYAITHIIQADAAFTTNRFTDQGIGSYGFGQEIEQNKEPYLLMDQKNQQTQCLQRGLHFKDVFPKNCAIQQVNILYKLNTYESLNDGTDKVKVKQYTLDGGGNSYSNPLCMACQPGYKPVISTLIKAVDRCVKIERCLSSNTFNKCEICEPGYVLKNDTEQSCVINIQTPKLNNCLIASTDNDQKCVQCYKGYYLNEDFQCNQFSAYKCKTQGFYQPQKSTLIENIEYNYDGIGCVQCNDDSILIQFTTNQPNCIKNDSLLLTSDLNTKTDTQLTEDKVFKTSFFIKNCEYYVLLQDKIKCQQCKDQYILQSNQEVCWPQSSFKNCKMTEIGGVICKQCNEKYYFESSTFTCNLGEIQNCNIYLNKNNCYQCNENYIAVSIKGNKTICFGMSEMNCTSFDSVQSIQGNLDCLQCSKDYMLISTGLYGVFPLVQCLTIPQIENCKEYNKSSISASRSSLLCAICKDNYYLKDNQCYERLSNYSKCLERQKDKDSCKNCDLGYYFNTELNLCKANPSSTQGCIEFKSNVECLKCKDNMYLKNNKCYKVDNLVQYCQYYLNNSECMQCQQNYFLDVQTCQQSYASNCLTQKSLKECEKCQQEYGLSQVGEIISCVQISVKNCETPDYNSTGPNFKCLQCQQKFYLDSNGICQSISSELNFCSYYKSTDKCLQCDNGYILSDDFKTCQNLDFVNDHKTNHCLGHQLSYQCSLCNPGFYFDNNGVCQSCSTGQGCLQCDSKNINKCLICSPGYYMNEKKECISSKVINDNTPVINTKIIDKLKIFLSMLMILI